MTPRKCGEPEGDRTSLLAIHAGLANPRNLGGDQESARAIRQQANIAHGPQQVNNDTPLPARTENATIAPNALLEAHTVTGLDTGATAAAGGGDPAVAAVGAIDGTAYT